MSRMTSELAADHRPIDVETVELANGWMRWRKTQWWDREMVSLF